MDHQVLFEELLHAEHEDHVVNALAHAGLDLGDDTIWTPLGQNAGNFTVVGNQQENAAAAFVEKIVNSIDAVLMGECYRQNILPDSTAAPSTIQQAVERFFNVPGGRLDNLSASEQRQLADRIHVVASGEKASPCYTVVDRGEGQTPNTFPDTFLSTSRSSPKIKINFVQGKFNAGGSGSLQFCGNHNIQLIVSRRQPYALFPDDPTSSLWGFTVVRRQRPRAGERSSVFVYLAPNGEVLRFSAPTIKVLPGHSGQNLPSIPYQEELDYGTAIKLYNYRLGPSGIATLECKRQLERALHAPCLPFRISETRSYRANYYATTVVGVWNSITSELTGGRTSRTMEAGFPAAANISLRGIGTLPIRIGVWKSTLDKRHYPTGVLFLQNGQVHGQFGPEFVSRQLQFDYIRDYIIVSVDCTSIDRSVAEDLLMPSRDRLRRNEHYNQIRDALASELKNHQGLKDLNAARRKERVDTAGDASTDVANIVSELIRADPGLATLFSPGGQIITSVGPGIGAPFAGKKFPTFFRLAKQPRDGIVRKACPCESYGQDGLRNRRGE